MRGIWLHFVLIRGSFKLHCALRRRLRFNFIATLCTIVR
jgi:hypothetical protein